MTKRVATQICLMMSILFIGTFSWSVSAEPMKSRDAPPELVKRIKKQIRASYGDECETPNSPRKALIFSMPAGVAPKLVQEWCIMGAYQLYAAHFLLWPDGRLEMLHFSVPVFEHRIEKKKDVSQTVIQKTTGYRTEWQLANPEYDPKTGTLRSFRLHRGVGDSQTRGLWRWHEKQGFVLEYYDTDQSYDGVLSPAIVYSRDKKQTPETFRPGQK